MDDVLHTRSDAHKGSGWYEALARVGLVAKGVSYGIVGVLAIGVAVGIGGEATSRQGALKQLADSAFKGDRPIVRLRCVPSPGIGMQLMYDVTAAQNENTFVSQRR